MKNAPIVKHSTSNQHNTSVEKKLNSSKNLIKRTHKFKDGKRRIKKSSSDMAYVDQIKDFEKEDS